MLLSDLVELVARRSHLGVVDRRCVIASGVAFYDLGFEFGRALLVIHLSVQGGHALQAFHGFGARLTVCRHAGFHGWTPLLSREEFRHPQTPPVLPPHLRRPRREFESGLHEGGPLVHAAGVVRFVRELRVSQYMVREPFLELRPRRSAGIRPRRIVQLIAGLGLDLGLHAEHLRPGAGLFIKRLQQFARRLEIILGQRPQVEEGKLRLWRSLPRLPNRFVREFGFTVGEVGVGPRVEPPRILGIVRQDRVGLLVDLLRETPAHELVRVESAEFRVVRSASDPLVAEQLAGFEGPEPAVVPKLGFRRLQFLGGVVGRRVTTLARATDQEYPGEQESGSSAGSPGTLRHRAPPGQGTAAWPLNLVRR